MDYSFRVFWVIILFYSNIWAGHDPNTAGPHGGTVIALKPVESEVVAGSKHDEPRTAPKSDWDRTLQRKERTKAESQWM